MMSRQGLSLSLLCYVVFVSNYGSVQATPTNAGRSNRNRTISLQTRIVDGISAQEGQFPWQAAVYIDNNFFCGGSIVDPEWILTAGHCVFKMHFFVVTVGSIYSEIPPIGVAEPDRQTITSMIGIAHPLYSPFIDVNDIGLIKLPVPLRFTPVVNAIPLATNTPQFQNLVFKPVTVSGWGKTSDVGQVALKLRYTTLTVIPDLICTLLYGDIIMYQKLCCGSLKGHSTCNGDSGGPLVYRALDANLYQVGIVSYGAVTCTHDIPVVFTKVSSFLHFIYTTTGLPQKQDNTSFPDQQRNQTH